MIIHKGEKYTITANGAVAEKSDGQSSRTMTFYPERDVSALAGEIDELTAWAILRDIAGQMLQLNTPISPQHILIDADRFVLSEWSSSYDLRLTAPEGYEPVWALGATVFYLFLGCHVFQGLGGTGQTPDAPVPLLRQEMPELSNLITRCLSYSPTFRPTPEDIVALAEKNYQRILKDLPDHPSYKKSMEIALPTDEIDRLWPDKMC